MKLTKTTVADLQAAEKDRFVWDSDLPAFGVRVKPGGRKTWVIRYRTQAGTSRMHTLGRVAELDPREAREIARRLFVEIRQGEDPSMERSTARASLTMQELYELWRREHLIPHCKPGYQRVSASYWKKHLRKHIAGRNIVELQRADLQEIHARMHRSASVANSCIAMVSSMFKLAIDRGLAEHNPAERIRWYRVRVRSYVLAPDEMRRLLEALDSPEVLPQFALLIRLLLLTGCRLREIMCARTEWIDWNRRLLLLPDSKTGQREVALSDEALELMEQARGREWLIPGRYVGHWKHTTTSWNRVKRLAQLPDVVRIHDLRHTVGSLSHAAGLTQKEIAIALGHKRLATTARYLTGFRGDHHDIAARVAAVVSVR